MKGFTLLEILIALAIFSIIGITTVKHIQLILNTKNTALEDIETYDSIRAAIGILRYDLSQAFHVLLDDLDPEVKKSLARGNKIAHTLFDGRKNEIVFTSLSHRVYYAGVKESDQAEISYFLQQRKGSKYFSLMKRESGIIDDDLYQGGQVYGILDNVVSWEVKYWDDKNTKWVDDWNSDSGQFRDRFPFAVKIKLVVSDRGKKDMPITTEIKLAFPNNTANIASF